MAKKKVFDNRGEADEVEEKVVERTLKEEFVFTDTTYCPVWNETHKRYDMLTIRVHGPTEQVRVERSPTRYDSKVRAMHDIIARISQEFIKK